MTIYNLIPVGMDKTPIIDSKGQINGHVNYSIDFKILEPYGNHNEITDLIEYDALSDPELKGKKLLITFCIKEGEGLPKKLCNKTFCSYEFFQTMGGPNLGQTQVEDGEEDDEDMDNIGDV